MRAMTAAERIARLRRALTSTGLAAMIVPSADPHQSEYPPERYRSRAYLSGFDGSAGTLVVTVPSGNEGTVPATAGVWTDSRYYVAAAKALEGSGIDLYRSGMPGVPEYPAWLAHNLPRGARVGVDPRMITIRQYREIATRLARNEIKLVAMEDPLDEVWPDRPGIPAEKVWPLETSSAGEAAVQKIQRLRSAMDDEGATVHVLTSLDDIAWLLNLRGSDVAYNPVFMAWVVVTPEAVTLYTDASRLTDDARASVDTAGVTVLPYAQFEVELTRLAGGSAAVLVDPDRTSRAIYDTLTGGAAGKSGSAGRLRIVEAPQPTTLMKARKNSVELENLRDAMIRDGRGMVRFLAWLERRSVARKTPPLDEEMAARRLQAIRREDDGYISDSFNYISGWGANGAIVHYAHDPAHPAVFGSRGIYLIDSGGQYRDGTTDITRTITVGTPSEEEREDFTLVLKGHIALARLHFPVGTAGRDIDVIARAHLWSHHRNYGHGTGHGVGFVLNVHEGPQKIAPGNSATPLEPGMVISNEPGLYREGRYGIRTENLMVVRPAGSDAFGDFLAFETISLCPIDLRLVDVDLLDAGEREWLNEYHRIVREELTDGLGGEDQSWLERATRPI
jgi:Xaa-Pro aminopeptidase